MQKERRLFIRLIGTTGGVLDPANHVGDADLVNQPLKWISDRRTGVRYDPADPQVGFLAGRLYVQKTLSLLLILAAFPETK